jgi:hypothetical protein
VVLAKFLRRNFPFLVFTILFKIFGESAQAQIPSGFNIFKAEDPIKIDGELNELTWQNAQKVQDFKKQFPVDSGLASSQTEVMVSYDDRHLFVAAICYDDTTKNPVVLNLRRDFALKTNDNFSVVLDPFGDGANGFNFAVTPLNTQREALITNGEFSFTLWDNRWFSHVHRKKNCWVVEMAIPFTSLRFNSGQDTWHINFSRTDISDNEISTWVFIPRTYQLTGLAFTADMRWDRPVKKTGTNVSLIPYAAINASKEKYPIEKPGVQTASFGGDAKVAVTSSLNLDLTVNPDYSNVEVDRQVTNLSRFEIFFPEQRQFFNENSDLFAQSGFTRIRPFFSRRIGLVKNPNAPGFVPSRILYGARLSGKLNPDLRVGLLNVQTAGDKALGTKGTNYTVATFQQKMFSRSNIAGMLVNRQILENDSGDFSFRNNRYNRILCLDYNLLSANNRWSGKFFYHHSFENAKPSAAFAHAVYLKYDVPRFFVTWNHEWVGSGYNPETGYLQRPKGFFRIEPDIGYRHYFRSKKLNYLLGYLFNDTYWDKKGKVSDQLYQFSGSLHFKSTASVGFVLSRAYTRLYSGAFDPTNLWKSGGARLDSNSSYWYNSAGINFASDARRKLSGSISLNGGQYFNGQIQSADALLSYRTGPFATIGISANYNSIRLPFPFEKTNFLLLGPKAEFSFSRAHFFTLFTQYNQQANNINLNARYQWRFAPMSDAFVVYSENYLPSPWKTKVRSLVLKLVYWLNV